MLHTDNLHEFTVKGYGATGDLIGGKTLQPIEIGRNKPKQDEVLIEVLYCGVCHSDLHQVHNDWKNTIYPCVPGHEVIGRVTEIGNAITKVTVGDIVGVGCMIDSCMQCKSCEQGDEQLCTGPVRMTMTYNGHFKPDPKAPEFNTFGGYSTHIVSKEHFVLKIPNGLKVSAAAPILCAGVTTYGPLKYRGVKAGDKVGIVGIGGLGHMGVMIAKAMGSEVVAISTQEGKRAAALELGADSVLISEDKEAMKAHEVSFDFILVTIPYPFDVNPYINLLAPRGSLVTVGLLGPYQNATNNMEVAGFSRSVGGSIIGSIAETQEVLNFCNEHGILPEVEMIKIQDVNEAFKKLKDEEVRFRYVIDMISLKNE